jgi:hypothetical protein
MNSFGEAWYQEVAERFHADIARHVSPEEYTIRFIWCIHAVRWTIDQLQAASPEQVAAR